MDLHHSSSPQECMVSEVLTHPHLTAMRCWTESDIWRSMTPWQTIFTRGNDVERFRVYANMLRPLFATNSPTKTNILLVVLATTRSCPAEVASMNQPETIQDFTEKNSIQYPKISCESPWRNAMNWLDHPRLKNLVGCWTWIGCQVASCPPLQKMSGSPQVPF